MGSANKTYFAGEYAWNRAGSGDADLAAWFREIEGSPVIIGDSFWSLFGHNVPNCDVSGHGFRKEGHVAATPTLIGQTCGRPELTLLPQKFVDHEDGLTMRALPLLVTRCLGGSAPQRAFPDEKLRWEYATTRCCFVVASTVVLSERNQG